MSDKLGIPPHDLRASAGAAGRIARDLEPPVKKAVNKSKDAASALKGWSFGTAVETSAEEWDTALSAMRKRIARSQDLLRDIADMHTWNDHDIYRTFSGDLKR
ncbi:hypothetical protein AB0I22_03975 [Streptomyces sp. NPDC050610]|uniref:hypothetical protein n=1 Tax=Streptomyces sp. NPDC050610 TaxID=3157097 RepID=UPI003420A4F5